MKSLNIYCNNNVKNSDKIIRSCTIEAKNGKRKEYSKVLKFELPLSIEPPDGDAEPYLIATILAAMAEKRTIKVHGSVSRTLLSNLTEFRDAWNCWLPDLYHDIDFEATNIDDSTVSLNNDAILSYSGGLDSTYTAWRHTHGLAGYRNHRIKACIMVRGFDIFKKEEFISAFNQAQDTLNDLGIPLMPINTNYRSIFKQDWNDIHGIALASCLNNFKALYSTAIIAGTYNYKKYPYGSNPLSDPLLSSSAMNIVNDGAKFTRDQKAVAISKWNKGVNNLRVCYSGIERHINCGICGKCIHTRLRFKIHGLEEPKSIPKLKNGKAIRKIFLPYIGLEIGYKEDFKVAKKNKIKIQFKSSYYYMIYRSKIIRGIKIVSPKILRNFLKKLYYRFTGKTNL
jgi:hypothetical protein